MPTRLRSFGSSQLGFVVNDKIIIGFRFRVQDAVAVFTDGDFSFQVASTARNGTLGGGADAWVPKLLH